MRIDYPRECELIGGYKALLTVAERNAWRDHIGATVEYAAMMASGLDVDFLSCLLCAGDVGREADYRAAVGKHRKDLEALYQMGKAWVANLPRTEGDASA